MKLSAFDVIGPAMVGPSSSHTAGAARIGRAARLLLGEPPLRARIGLHGSFAATGGGHATDRALVAGLLGCAPDDTRLPDSLSLAAAGGLAVEFTRIDLGEDAHPNSAQLHLEGAARRITVTGASLGGGMIALVEIDGHALNLGCTRSTLVCWHEDRVGFIAALTAQLAYCATNIAMISMTRKIRGGESLAVVEADDEIPRHVTTIINAMQGVNHSCLLPSLP